MIQSPTLIPATLLAPPGEAALTANGEIAKGADFGALLAISVAPIVTAVPAAEPAPVAATLAMPSPDIPPSPATSGNVLPVSLPQTNAETENRPLPTILPAQVVNAAGALPTTLVASLAPTGRDEPEIKPDQAAPMLEPAAKPKAQRGNHKLISTETRIPSAPIARKTAYAATAEPEATDAPVAGQPITQVALALAEPGPELPQSLRANSTSPKSNPGPAYPSVVPTGVQPGPDVTAPPPLHPAPQPQPQSQPHAQAAFEHAAPQAAFLRASTVPTEPQPIPEQPAAGAAAPARPLRIEIALPPQIAAVTRSVTPVALRQLAQTERESIAAPIFAGGSPAPQIAPQLAPQSAPLDRPQDFTALLDRLIAAREAAAPQRVSVTLPHAEFGPVHLRFRQEDGALAISMTSADPEFARAASLAAPPAVPTAEARAGSGSASHSENSANAPSTGSGQPRGQAAERRADQPSRDNPSPRTAGPDKPARRNGIFA